MKMKLTYIGKRLNGENLVNAFVHGHDYENELYWSGRKLLKIGGLYESIKEGEDHKMSKSPEYLGDSDVTPEQRGEWMSAEVVAESINNQRLARIKAAKENELLDKIDALKPYVVKLSYQEKRAFLEYVLDKWTITHVPSTKKLNHEKNQWKRYAKRLAREALKAANELKKKESKRRRDAK